MDVEGDQLNPLQGEHGLSDRIGTDFKVNEEALSPFQDSEDSGNGSTLAQIDGMNRNPSFDLKKRRKIRAFR